MTVQEVKRNLNKPVLLTIPRLYMENSKFILTACIIRRGDKGFFYQAELQDVHNENSILICNLEDIQEDKNEHTRDRKTTQ